MSRNVVPYELAKLRGNPGKRRLHPGPQPARTEQPPEPLEFLLPAAKAEWSRLAPELHALGLLTALDVTLFGLYCQSVARWLLAEELLAKAIREAAADGDDGGGLVVAGSKGAAVINPLLKVTVQAARDVCRYAAEFGFTPASRARFRAGYQPPPEGGSQWDGLLA
jgi:P27 family predicted phage terminase small subunit